MIYKYVCTTARLVTVLVMLPMWLKANVAVLSSYIVIAQQQLDTILVVNAQQATTIDRLNKQNTTKDALPVDNYQLAIHHPYRCTVG